MAKIPNYKKEKGVDVALIDGDVIRYELGAVCLDHPYVKGAKIPAPANFIKNLVDAKIEEITDATGVDDFVVYFTGGGNFRFDIATVQPYKGNRADFQKPYHWKTVDFILKDQFKCKTIEGSEADDALALRQFESLEDMKDGGIKTVICSRDKDLRMTEGYHYSWACGKNQPEKPLYWVTKLEGHKFFFKQMLTGDGTDHILGCAIKEKMVYKSGAKKGQECIRRKGVGPAKADKLLAEGETCQEWYNIVQLEYKNIYPDNWEDIMMENARLLYIGQTYENRFEWDWLGVVEKGSIPTNEVGEDSSEKTDDERDSERNESRDAPATEQ